MTRKPTTKSPAERRLRKEIRALIRLAAAGTKEDIIVREFLALIDDEVRRERMSIAPVVFSDNTPHNATCAPLPSVMTSRATHIVTKSDKKDWEEWAGIGLSPLQGVVGKGKTEAITSGGKP